MQWYCYGGDTVATRARPWLEQMRLIQRLLSEMRMKSYAMTRKPECLSYLWGYKCSITSEALLWFLCSWRSNDIQAILAICRTRVSRTQEARNWTTLFQDVKIECIKFRLTSVWVGQGINVKEFGDVTLAWEDEEWLWIVWKLQIKVKVLWLEGCYLVWGRYSFGRSMCLKKWTFICKV